MNNPPFSPPATEQDARNRAAQYMQTAAQQAEQLEQAQAQQRTSEFQQLLWLKNLDHSHALELRTAEQRHTLELEEKKRDAALELRKLELRGLSTDSPRQQQSVPFWKSQAFIAFITIAIPLAIPPLIRALFGKKIRGRQRWRKRICMPRRYRKKAARWRRGNLWK